MSRTLAIPALAIPALATFLLACKSESDTEVPVDPEPVKPAASRAGSAGGFSARLTADILAATGSGSAGAPMPPATGQAAVGSGSAAAAGSGSGLPPAAGGSGSAGSGGSGAAPAAGTATAVPTTAGAASPSAGSGSAKPIESGGAAAAAMGSGSASSVPGVVTAARGELKAIQLSLGPNWERDVKGPGTISLDVKGATVFTFHYGYDPANAPTDREQYKQFLASTKLLTVTSDRQRGSAWYLEGTDQTGHAAFRYLVNYGGKRLVCFGSLYKDPEFSRFGDKRDDVVVQAKSICESLAL